MKKSRRQFLRNTSLIALSSTFIPVLGKSNVLGSNEATQRVDCDPTTEDFYGQGPFYTANAPSISNNLLAPTTEVGTRLILSGRVHNIDCTEFIADTVIDVWHADDNGVYDNAGYKLRGKTLSNSQGFYIFETIYPGKYLNGSVFRPSHIHFKITPPGFPELTTQLYFDGDPDNSTDPASSVNSGIYDATDRIIPLTANANGELEGTWDIVVNGNGLPLGAEDLHTTMGMIYAVFPNPIASSVKIKYGVFRQAKVTLSVYNIQGQLIADLQESTLKPEKYEAEWSPDPSMPAGHYFIALKVNDVQVHYLKVVKQ